MKNKKNDVKKVKKPLSKDAKKLIIVGVVFVVLFSIVFGIKIGTNNAVKNTSNLKGAMSIAVSVMPKSVEIETSTGPKEFYLEKSEEFDTMFDEAYDEETGQYNIYKLDITRALNFYYYSSENKRVDLAAGQYTTQNDDIWVISYFLDSFSDTLQTLNSVYTGIMVALVCAFVIYLIYVWYKAWSVKEDKRVAMLKDINSPKKSKDEEE